MVAGALSLGSCIAENMDDCPPRLFVKTKYETRAGGSTRLISTATPIEEWYNRIENVTVYIFDENDRFVTLWEGGAYTVGEEYEVPLDKLGLREGIYNVVAWTNCGEASPQYNVGGLGEGVTLEDLTMALNVPPDGTLRDDINHIHWGLHPERIHYSSKSKKSSHVIEIAPVTHKVNFSVSGLEGEGPYEVTVTDRNARHSFRNGYISGDYYRHVRSMSAADDTRAEAGSALVASMILMQIQDDSGTSFEIGDTASGQTVELPELPSVGGLPDYPAGDLVGFITKIAALNGSSPDFENTREFDIAIDYRTGGGGGGAGAVIVISVNQWEYVINETVL
jgi:hypothetical protein